MIPTINEKFLMDFEEKEVASKDFAIEYNSNRVAGVVDNLEEVKQAIYIILNTERYEHLIYSWNYGVELNDLIGQPMSYVIPEAERRITEALLQDDRIENVSDFVFEKVSRGVLHVTFAVKTVFGNLESEVDINV